MSKDNWISSADNPRISSSQQHPPPVNFLSTPFHPQGIEHTSSTIDYYSLYHLRIHHGEISLKPGSHMSPTYLGHSCWHDLGHRYGVCEHLSRNRNLSQAMTASLPAKFIWVQTMSQVGRRDMRNRLNTLLINPEHLTIGPLQLSHHVTYF